MRSQNLENLPNDYKELTSYQFEQMPLADYAKRISN